MSKSYAIVLLSSGLDSTVNCYLAKKKYAYISSLYFDYGQKAAVKELNCASRIAKTLQIPFQSIELPWLKGLGASALTSDSVDIPKNLDLQDPRQMQHSAGQVWVPNRNAIFIHIATAFAENKNADIIVGFNKEEAMTFPDNSAEFVKAINRTLSFSTSHKVVVKSYTLLMNKIEIIKLGKELDVNFDLIWSCYKGEQKPCGHCESCLRMKLAWENA